MLLGNAHECCYCWMTGNTAHIHEIMLSRGMVQKNAELSVMIHDVRNCGWVCMECHKYAEGQNGTFRGILYLASYLGWEPLEDFINEVSLLSVTIAKEMSFILSDMQDGLYDDLVLASLIHNRRGR